jgi:hypothetical protein
MFFSGEHFTKILYFFIQNFLFLKNFKAKNAKIIAKKGPSLQMEAATAALLQPALFFIVKILRNHWPIFRPSILVFVQTFSRCRTLP